MIVGFGATRLQLNAVDAMAAKQVARALVSINPKLADASSDLVTEVGNSAAPLSSLFLSRFADHDLTIQSVALIHVILELMSLRDRRDSLSELGEQDQLRLQMVMDRLAKLYTTLSNLMKKISETAQSIVQNMK